MRETNIYAINADESFENETDYVTSIMGESVPTSQNSSINTDNKEYMGQIRDSNTESIPDISRDSSFLYINKPADDLSILKS